MNIYVSEYRNRPKPFINNSLYILIDIKKALSVLKL